MERAAAIAGHHQVDAEYIAVDGFVQRQAALQNCRPMAVGFDSPHRLPGSGHDQAGAMFLLLEILC
ncbi:MAG: hypothetical protein P8Z73_13850 [Desulfobacteraceae bacterium]